MNFAKSVAALGATSALLFSAHASAVTITFDDLADGAVLSTQYAALGAIFSANAFSGAGGPTGVWATNTDMTVTSTDLGGVGTPSLVSGNLLHSFNGWLDEDGDASFKITFTSAISSISAMFAGVSTPADVHLYVYNGATLLSTVTGTVTTGQYTLSYAAPSITSVVITPGSFNDWVGVDNINYTVAVVPEPATYAMLALGLAVVGAARRLNGPRQAA